jgi:RNA polymerase sigma-54 factor
MKQSLQLKFSQSLTMTPQLQQAIKLLQLSSLELEAEIQEVLESNPLLEVEPSQEQGESFDKNPLEENPKIEALNNTAPEEKDTSDAINSDKIESEMIADTQWEDWGYVSQASSSKSDDNSNFEFQGETSDSLRDQLLWQINMMALSDTDRTIAMILIDSIDDSGFMKADLGDVIVMLNGTDAIVDFSREPVLGDAIKISLSDTPNSRAPPSRAEPAEVSLATNGYDESQITFEEVEAVLHLIQSFEPPGIAARNLQECLLIQLKRLENNHEHLALAQQVVNSQFDFLASRNYRLILKNLGINEQQLKQAIELIQNLDPRPGNQLNQNNAQYIKPDVYVSKNKLGKWVVSLNAENTQKLRVNNTYASLIKRADNSTDNQFLKNNLQDAKWFIKSLQSRNDTLLKVATSIVEKQNGFLEYGEEAMKPLVLHNIAEEVGMHESTISRVTTQKFLHTPKGIFELKYFFSSHVSTASGGECSSTAIRAVIKKLVAAENHTKPLSDSKIATLLKDQGIKVARRTVAKYRESLAIPPSNERKSLM